MIEASFTKLVGCSNPAPCVTVGVGRHAYCWCRLDTGADFTVLPMSILENCTLNDGKAHVRSYNGHMQHVKTYSGWILLDGRNIYLKKILPTKMGTGLLGLDVLSRFTLLMEGNKITLE